MKLAKLAKIPQKLGAKVLGVMGADLKSRECIL